MLIKRELRHGLEDYLMKIPFIYNVYKIIIL